MSTVIPVLLVLVIVVALMTASALFVPKGPNQVSVYELTCIAHGRILRHTQQGHPNRAHDFVGGVLFDVDGHIYGPTTSTRRWVFVGIHARGTH